MSFFEVVIDVILGLYYLLQWLLYLLFGIKPPPHTSPIFKRDFYTLRLALPLRLLVAFGIYALFLKPWIYHV